MTTQQQILSFGLCLALAFTGAHASSRQILANDGSSVFTDDDSMVFQLVSEASGSLVTYGTGFVPTALNVTLEMDTAATYSENWRDDDPRSWEAGNTRMNVTTAWSAANAPNGAITATLFTQACTPGVAPSSIFYNEANDTSSYVQLPIRTNNGTTQTTSGIWDYLINYDAAQSLVLFNGATAVACTSIVPPMPDFPDEWSGLLEANSPTFGVTFLMQLYYSQALQKTRSDFSSSSGDRIILQDFKNKNTTVITPANATYPYGYCEARGFSNFTNRFVDDDTDLLVGTADFLFFDQDNATYQQNHEMIRGIECEEWKTSRTSNYGGSFDVSYYFPVNQWVVVRQDYHRLLKQVYINGTSPRGSFENYLNYVNLKPRNYTVDSTAFNVCAIAPMGKNCNCTKQEVADLVGLLINDESGVVAVSNENTAATEDICTTPHGFVKQQAGPYIGLVILALLAGMGMMFAATLVYFRAVVGVGLRDRVGHARFQEG